MAATRKLQGKCYAIAQSPSNLFDRPMWILSSFFCPLRSGECVVGSYVYLLALYRGLLCCCYFMRRGEMLLPRSRTMRAAKNVFIVCAFARLQMSLACRSRECASALSHFHVRPSELTVSMVFCCCCCFYMRATRFAHLRFEWMLSGAMKPICGLCAL